MRRQHRGTTGARSGRTAAGAVFHPSVTGAHRLRHIPPRRLVCAAIALAALPAVAATFPIDLHPDWGDMNISAETGTIEGSRPLTYVMLQPGFAQGTLPCHLRYARIASRSVPSPTGAGQNAQDPLRSDKSRQSHDHRRALHPDARRQACPGD